MDNAESRFPRRVLRLTAFVACRRTPTTQPVPAIRALPTARECPARLAAAVSNPRYRFQRVLAGIVGFSAGMASHRGHCGGHCCSDCSGSEAWESQKYKDCVSANQGEINGTSITQNGIESYCHNPLWLINTQRG